MKKNKKRNVVIDLWGFRQEYWYPILIDGLSFGDPNGYHEVTFQESMLFPRDPSIRLSYFKHERLAKFKAIFWSTDGEYYFLKKIITAPQWQLPKKAKEKKT